MRANSGNLSQKFREIHFTKFLVKSILRNLSCLRFINTLHSKMMAAVCSSKNTSSYVLLVPTVCKRSYTVHMLWRQNDRQNLKGHQHREKGFEIFFIKNGDVNISFFLYRITKFDGTFLIIHFRLLFFLKIHYYSISIH